jgi:hypothetical protein
LRVLPVFAECPYEARFGSEAAVYMGQLLAEAAPRLEVVAIARRPGVLAKVAVLDAAQAGDAVDRVREQLEGERIEVVVWDPEPRRYITRALGMAEEPAMVLKPGINHVQVLVGEIDLRGMNGWRGINRLLASALTGWRIRLLPIGESAAWRALESAQAARRSIRATVVGTRVEVHGLYARLAGRPPLEEELDVHITRMDPDEGTIRVARTVKKSRQPALF